MRCDAEIGEQREEAEKAESDPIFGFHHALPQLLPVVERRGDFVGGRRLADQALDDRCGGVGRDAAHIAHGGRARRRDRLFRRRQPLVQLRFELFVAASAAAACCSRVELAIAWARLRASASDFS